MSTPENTCNCMGLFKEIVIDVGLLGGAPSLLATSALPPHTQALGRGRALRARAVPLTHAA